MAGTAINLILLEQFGKELLAKLKSGELKIERLNIKDMSVENAIYGPTATATLNSMFSNYIQTGDIGANHGIIDYLQGEFIKYDSAEFKELYGENGEFKNLVATTGELSKLVAGTVNASDIKTIHLSADTVSIDDALVDVIGTKFLTGEKAEIGTIYTNKFKILSSKDQSNGYAQWYENLITMVDGNGTLRMVLGKYPDSKDYNVLIYNPDGELIFNATGVTQAGLENKIAETLNTENDLTKINADRLNIGQIVEKINGARDSEIYDAFGNPLYDVDGEQLYTDVIRDINTSAIIYDGESLETAFRRTEEKVGSLEDTTTDISDQYTAFKQEYDEFKLDAVTSTALEDRISQVQMTSSKFSIMFQEYMKGDNETANVMHYFHMCPYGFFIAVPGSGLTLVLTNDEVFFTNTPIDFSQSESMTLDTFAALNRVSYWKDDMFYNKKVRVEDRLDIGNFVHKKKKNGGYTFRRVRG